MTFILSQYAITLAKRKLSFCEYIDMLEISAFIHAYNTTDQDEWKVAGD